MNRLLIIILFVIVQTTALSQAYDSISVDPELKRVLIDNLGKSWMEDIIPFERDEHYNFFAPIYLNNDTLVDFVYYDPSGGEPFMTTIYLNTGNKLEQVKSGIGSIYRYDKPFLESPSLIHFVEWGCCDDPHNIYQLWTLNNDLISESDQYHFLEETQLPKDMRYSFSISVQNTPYTLRATPEIINENFHYHYDKGNIIAEFSKGDIGHVLSTKTDSTGRVWYFVIMEKPSKVGYHNYKIYKDEKWMGWMSSRFVEIINGR